MSLKKVEEKQKEFTNEMSDMLKGKNKTGWQIHAINNMKKLYESQENVIKLFDKCF